MRQSAAKLFRSLDRELWVITAQANGKSGGLISTTVSQASIDETLPRLTVGLAIHHETSKLVHQSQAFAAHLVGRDQSNWIRHFGTQSGRDLDKLEDWEITTSITQSPILNESRAWLDCRIENLMETGDRRWYLAKIVDAKWTEGFNPLTFQTFLSQADDDLKALLKKQLGEDSLTDNQLISNWRRSRRSS